MMQIMLEIYILSILNGNTHTYIHTPHVMTAVKINTNKILNVINTNTTFHENNDVT